MRAHRRTLENEHTTCYLQWNQTRVRSADKEQRTTNHIALPSIKISSLIRKTFLTSTLPPMAIYISTTHFYIVYLKTIYIIVYRVLHLYRMREVKHVYILTRVNYMWFKWTELSYQGCPFWHLPDIKYATENQIHLTSPPITYIFIES